MKELLPAGEVKSLSKRGIQAQTCQKFGYTVGKIGDKNVQVAPYYDKNGYLVAQHIRTPDKEFFWRGNSKDAVLFGRHLWRSGGKRIILTEGEIDALTVAQVLGLRWPVCSIPNGAAGAKRDVQKNIEFLEGFEEVVFCFDSDEPGREASLACAQILTPGKARIVHLPLKDPNEMLQAGKTSELVTALWDAQVYRPDGVVTLAEITEQVLAPIQDGSPWPWPGLTAATYGRRYGEVYTLGAGTGVGKTDVMTQVAAYDLLDLKEPVALFYLEQHPVETTKRLAGKIAGKRFHVPDGSWEQDELIQTLKQMEASGQLYLYNHFGSTEWDIVKTRVRYLAVAHGVKKFYLDHLTALAAHAEDERKALEALMAEIAGMAQELGLIIHMVSHLATPEGKPHEEGGRVMIRHFKGSRAIGYWSHFMLGLERNQQAKDESERHITTLRILKDRYTGQGTGKTFYLKYDAGTGRLIELEKGPDDASEVFQDEEGF